MMETLLPNKLQQLGHIWLLSFLMSMLVTALIERLVCLHIFISIFFWLSFTGGPRLESGTEAVSGAAEGSTVTTKGADERDFPLHVMTWAPSRSAWGETGKNNCVLREEIAFKLMFWNLAGWLAVSRLHWQYPNYNVTSHVTKIKWIVKSEYMLKEQLNC